MTETGVREQTPNQPEAELVEFEGEGVRLRGDRWPVPDAKGVAILLHGGGQTRHSWHRAGPRLAAAGWDTISLDQRGHGDSDWAPDGKYGLGTMARDLYRVVDSLDAGPPVLVGASMGGSVSLLATGDRPGFARALVLVDIAPRIEPAGVARITGFMRSRADGFASLEEVAEAIRAYNPHRSRPPSVDGLRKNVRLRDGRWYWHWDPAFMNMSSEPMRDHGYDRQRDAARAVTVPTLLVRGAQSDVVSDAGAQELLELIPGSRYVDVSGSGHMVAGDDNDVFAGAVLNFLAEL